MPSIKKTLTFRPDETIHKRIKEMAKERGISKSVIVNLALFDWIKKTDAQECR
jgi:predicted transcriptional regulator